jgi:DNA topoisomerase I
MRKLMIVESPGKTGKLQEILGRDWVVAASLGHVRDLPERELGLTGPDLRPKYEVTERRAHVIKKLKALSQTCDEVYLATDPDREGEAIAYHLQQTLNLRNPKRCTFSAINEGAVIAAVASPRQINMLLVEAQEARRCLDRLVGYTVSPRLTEKAGTRMSAGRVQSPAVRLVVERDRAIAKFKSTLHYSARAVFGTWTADWDVSVQFKEEPHYCLDKKKATAIAGVNRFTVDAYESGKRRVRPHAAFTTSTLQQEGSVRLQLSPGETMQIAQRLYEKGLITYHRTDNPNISEEGSAALREYGKQCGLAMADANRAWKTSENAQEAHEAIRPVDPSVDGSKDLDGVDEKLYRLIRIRAIASQAADAVYNTSVARLRGRVGSTDVFFDGKGEVIVEDGWLAVWKDIIEDDDEVKNPIPTLQVGTDLVATSNDVVEHRTKAPKFFTEASLIRELERKGIGRPATYAAIMEKILKSGYVTKDKRQRLKSTPFGEQLTDALVGKLSFIDVEFTRAMEVELDEVARGERSYPDVLRKVQKTLSVELALVTKMGKAAAESFRCGRCQADLRHLLKKGHYDFWGCTKFPDCAQTYQNKAGKPDYEGRAKANTKG